MLSVFFNFRVKITESVSNNYKCTIVGLVGLFDVMLLALNSQIITLYR